MSYPGGKNGSGVYQKIINLMPRHEIYIEPFLGSGAILRLKKPAPLANIGIDKDAAVIDAFCLDSERSAYLICDDAITYLRNSSYVDLKSTLIYLDPPYLMSTRASKHFLYTYEMTTWQHIELLELIRQLPCMVMISGYYSDLYASNLSNWRSINFQAKTRGNKMATEWVWMNFPEPIELHDYSYLGSNFRERERIKKKQRRWKARLEKMPDLERYSLLSVIADLTRATTSIYGDGGSTTVIDDDSAVSIAANSDVTRCEVINEPQ